MMFMLQEKQSANQPPSDGSGGKTGMSEWLCQVREWGLLVALKYWQSSVFSFQNKMELTKNKNLYCKCNSAACFLLRTLQFHRRPFSSSTVAFSLLRLEHNHSKAFSFPFRLKKTWWRFFSIKLPLSFPPYVHISGKVGAEISPHDNREQQNFVSFHLCLDLLPFQLIAAMCLQMTEIEINSVCWTKLFHQCEIL